MRKSKETLVGDFKLLEYLGWKYDEVNDPHPLQGVVEEAIGQLDEDLREVFYMRYGLGMTIRAIAREQDYDGHQIIQYKLEKIESAVREAVEGSSADS